MRSFIESMRQGSITDIECIAKPDSPLYVVLGYTGDEMTGKAFDASLEEAVRRLFGYRRIPGMKTVQRWLRTEPGRIFVLTRQYDGHKQIDFYNERVEVSLGSQDGDAVYRDAIEFVKML